MPCNSNLVSLCLLSSFASIFTIWKFQFSNLAMNIVQSTDLQIFTNSLCNVTVLFEMHTFLINFSYIRNKKSKTSLPPLAQTALKVLHSNQFKSNYILQNVRESWALMREREKWTNCSNKNIAIPTIHWNINQVVRNRNTWYAQEEKNNFAKMAAIYCMSAAGNRNAH